MDKDILTIDWKSVFRRRALAARDAAAKDPANANAAEAASAQTRLFLDLQRPCNIALYVPMGSELDTASLAAALMFDGHALLLPVVTEKGAALAFRLWEADVDLVRGAYGTAIPPDAARVCVPDVVIVPLLGVRPDGARLGMGGGYYDRTLRDLRQSGNILAVGYGYDAQIMERFPVEAHDQSLDAFVSDKRVMRFGKRPD